MKKLRNLFCKTGFILFLFFVCLVLFNWPLMSIPDRAGTDIMFIYLFSVWGIIVFLLFVIRKCYDKSSPGEENKGKGRFTDV
jgi:hypothetical protein